MTVVRTASCVCGGLSVEASGEPEGVGVCHCGACRARTGSAFSVNARFRRERCVPRGEARVFTRKGDSGGTVVFHFCPACGASVYWEPDGLPGFVVVAVGAFRDRSFPAPRRAVYTAEKLDWVETPGCVTEVYD